MDFKIEFNKFYILKGVIFRYKKVKNKFNMKIFPLSIFNEIIGWIYNL